MYKCPNCENALQINFNVCPYCGMNLNISMKNNAKKICCTDSGGIWENETCVSLNAAHEYYIIQSYNSCLTDSGLD